MSLHVVCCPDTLKNIKENCPDTLLENVDLIPTMDFQLNESYFQPFNPLKYSNMDGDFLILTQATFIGDNLLRDQPTVIYDHINLVRLNPLQGNVYSDEFFVPLGRLYPNHVYKNLPYQRAVHGVGHLSMSVGEGQNPNHSIFDFFKNITIETMGIYGSNDAILLAKENKSYIALQYDPLFLNGAKVLTDFLIHRQ